MQSFRPTVSRLLPLGAALAVFFAVSALYFAPQFAGETLLQHDVLQYKGMTREIELARAATGEDPQWTGSMFGGMPAYLINVAYPAQLVKRTVGQIVGLVGTPAGFLFFAMLSMWCMLLIVGVDPWVGIVPALAYGLSTYFLLIIGAGHVTKMWALVYAPLMMGGAWVTLRRNKWLGAALTALAASLEIGANHPQITYYFLLAMALFWMSEGIAAWRRRTLGDFGRRTALLAAAGILALASNFSPLWYTARHSQDTLRGGSELVTEAKSPARGLDLQYATAWSYGIAESWNLLIPDFMGGDSGRSFSDEGEVARTLKPYGLEGAARQLPAYWGDQPYTGGPTYLGAVALFLAALGIGLTCGRDRWWIVAASLLALLLAWGRHLMPLTEFAFNYLPGYNKFRTVSMTLVVVQWAVPLLGALGLMGLWRCRPQKERLKKALAWAAGVTGGICLLFALAGGSLFDFGREADAETMTVQFGAMLQQAGMEDAIRQGLHERMGIETADAMAAERAAAMRADAWRSLLFIVLAAAAVGLYLYRRFPKGVLLGVLGVLMLADLVPVDLRYLPHERFGPERTNRIVATPADRKILQDKEPGYRVLNLTVSPFNDATTSYFHRSVGGYHGAKLARYQDLIDRYLVDFDDEVLDMLDTRYVILSPDSVIRRESANGAAWLVEGVVRAATPQEEIDRLGEIDTRRTAVVADRFALRDASFGQGAIRLEEYRPNYLRYTYEADAPALAVFSEIYYDKGWKAFVDGREAPYLRADYVLRAMELPAGQHTVEWRFRSPGWASAEAVTLAASLAILTAALAALVYLLKNKSHERR